ncbi:MAG: hypothetical protein B5766_08895 [Candidatus Lumbricidophila eiseniae]|uniref:Uncharacterized protein n=1 Tax=Candidatus Lumbricidiphila eiseniae TaxID=1969409 RepID=A0A2A6FQC3_9MICO|nr:MAG: hypothetical protein B5766_08895 [Candidatus Lumbricidophila eiseniae]
MTRYRTEGEAGLEDRSSRPLSMPTKTSENAEAAVLALRQDRAALVGMRSRCGLGWSRGLCHGF